MPLTHSRALGFRLFLLVAGRVGLLIFSLLSTGVMTRDLGPHGFGDYRAAVGYLGMIVLLADLGLASIFVREISVPNADYNRVVGSAISLRLVLACAAIAGALALVFALPFTDEARQAALWAAPGFLAYSLHLMIFGLFQQKMKQSQVIMAEITGAIVLVAAVVALRGRGASAAAFCGALSLSYVTTLAIALFHARRHASLVPRFDPAEWSRLLRASVPLAVGTTMTIATYQSPTLLLAMLTTPEVVGNYGVPLKIFDSLMGIGLLAIGLAAPLLANAAASDGERLAGVMRGGLQTMLLGGTALALVLASSAPLVVAVVAGPAFTDSASTLQLFALLFVVHTCSLFLRESATAMHLQNRIAGRVAPAMAIAFAGFALLIPRYGGNGAVLALIVSETFLLFNFLRLLRGHSSVRLPPGVFAKLAAAGLIAAAAVYACHLRELSWWMTTALVLPVYGLSLLAVGSIAVRDIRILAAKVQDRLRGGGLQGN